MSGVTDATVPLTSLPDVVAKYVTAGYVAPDTLPSQVAFGATGAADVVVTLAHGSAVQVTQHKVTNTVHYVNEPTALAFSFFRKAPVMVVGAVMFVAAELSKLALSKIGVLS